MVYIKGLKFRGFKSFRRAEASFPNGYVCLAGPNGSGKSNITDGIRFALGEGSLKALRAKRVSELVNTSCKFAEVTLFIDGEQQYEIRRAINSEGKTLYRINGRRTTRTLVMEELRPYGLEAGSHNIIAQGQVQKIIEMSSKERRQIIDGIAGISEFDAKKEEALSELGKVDAKINEANVVLGERQMQMTELEKQKDEAVSYMQAQENFRRAMASIASLEHSKLSKSHADTVQKFSAIKGEAEELEKQSSVLSARSSELSAQQKAVTDKIASSGSREAAMQEIGALKESMSSDSATLAAQKKEAERLEAMRKSSLSQTEAAKKSQKECSGQCKSLSDQASKVASEIAELDKKTASGNVQSEEAASRLESLSAKIMSLKEQKAASESSLLSAQKMLEMKLQEKGRLTDAVGKIADDKLSGEISVLQKEALSLQSHLDSLFEQEKELNRALPDIDRRLFASKDRAATLRASIAPSAASMALRAVEEMKQGGMKGIYGAVSSLISCDPKYSTAVEASAGQRLSYVVVDNTATALKIIEKLKAQKSGRCTIIPLDLPRPSVAKGDGAPGSLGRLIDFTEFDAAFQPAMDYVFSDTMLFENADKARKGGYGRARMVTLEGELFEKSGIISGGSMRGSLLSKAALDKVEAEAESLKKEKDSLFARLYSLREEMNAKRREKAEAEVKLKGIEIEMKASEEKRSSQGKALAAIRQIESEMQSAQQELARLKKSAAALESEISSASSEHESLRSRLSSEQEKSRKADAESVKKLTSLHAQRSSLEAQLQARNAEFERLSALRSEKEKEAEQALSELSECSKQSVLLQKKIAESAKQCSEKEAKLSEMSAGSSRLMAKLRELDAQLAELSVQAGKLRGELDRKNRELMDIEVRRQTAETRLADLKAALEQYSGVPTIDASKQELEALAKKGEETMNALGQVNLKAPELYEQKKKDIDDIRSRVDSLSTEKNAVFHMMEEIETKKRAIFLSTFTAVNDNFRRLFSYVFKGEGTLLLENSSSPFDSGLLVKVRDESHDKYLDSMSGGEKSLLALIFIFAIQMHKAAPFYILDEADAALDKENSKKLSDLIRQLAVKTQFIVVTHNDTVLSNADVALGVTRTEDGSKIVGVQLTSSAVVAKTKKA